MSSLKTLQKRVDELEKPIMGGMDIDVFVLDSLSDNEIDLLAELRGLYKAGFSAEEIEVMMKPGTYEMAIEVAQKVNETIELLTAPPLIKIGKAKKRKAEIIDLYAEDDVEESDIADLEIA